LRKWVHNNQLTSRDGPRKASPKEASTSVIAKHAATLKALPFSDVRDFDDAARCFLNVSGNAKAARRVDDVDGRVSATVRDRRAETDGDELREV
jgi:alkyl sulfatase BDS1-like metallo-beta-lactamase superfamily hydrolase